MQKIIFYKNFIEAINKAEQFEMEIHGNEFTMLITFTAHGNAQEEVSKPAMDLLRIMPAQSRVIGEVDGMLMDIQEMNTTFSEELDENAYPMWAKCNCIIKLVNK